MKTNVNKGRVFVGLSGGVDSAVTAALLKEDGYDVVGVFIKGWYPEGLPCTWALDRRDAMRVAAHLYLPFVTLDASKEYKKAVIDYLLSEYRAGRTPNPDIFCNKEVKFGAFYQFAKEKGADYIATGHYAISKDGKLYRGVDPLKDQSYFLWAITKEALNDTLFPLGSLTKETTRGLAKRFNLPVKDKKDSQGICFLGPVSVEDFLTHELGSMRGEAKTEDGQVVGMHKGVVLYTLGERVSLKGTLAGPWYVLAKDLEKNELMVSKERTPEVASRGISFKDANWFTEPTQYANIEAQYRYHGPNVKGTLTASSFIPDDTLPEPATPGQSIVLYVGNLCIGGATISSSD